MLEPGDAGKGDNATVTRWFDDARDGRIAAERHVRSVVVVILGVEPNQTEQVAFAEHDHMIEYLAS